MACRESTYISCKRASCSSRFNSSCSLLAPDFSGSDDDPVPIGTLCIIDNKPRDQFTTEQRQKMNDLALLAQKTIANWSRARFRARLDAMERSFQMWKNEAAALADGPGANLGLYQGARENRYALPAASLNGLQPHQKSIEYSDGIPDRSHFNEAPSNTVGTNERSPDLYISQVPQNAKSGTGVIGNGDAQPAPQQTAAAQPQQGLNSAPISMTNKQKIYDISTRLVGDSLELTLVYILRLNISHAHRGSADTTNDTTQHDENEGTVQSLSLVSSFGLPSPEPAFDAVLHMKALRSEEGGLLYQNPRADELRAGERMPQTEEVEYAVSHGTCFHSLCDPNMLKCAHGYSQRSLYPFAKVKHQAMYSLVSLMIQNASCKSPLLAGG